MNDRDIENVRKIKKIIYEKNIWQEIFDSIPDSIFVLSVDNRIIMANKATEKLFDVKLEDIEGTNCYSFVHGTIKPPKTCPHVETIKTKKTTERIIYEPLYSTYLEVITIPLFHDGEIYATIHISRNLRDVMKENETLKLLNAELDKKNELIKSLIGLASHDLRSPLSVIKGYTEIIRSRYGDDENIRYYSEKMDRAVKQMSGMIKRIVDILQFYKKHIRLNREIIDIATLINEIKENFALMITRKNISLSIDTTKNTGEDSIIIGDKVLLSNVINNILSNSIKFTNEGGNITIKTYPEEKFLVIKISDNGIGIPKQMLSKIFIATSVELHRIGTNGEEGSGIGLDICYHIIKLMSGEIKIDSEERRGTDVYIKIPKNKRFYKSLESGGKEL